MAHHYLPSIAGAAPNTRKNTASHLGTMSGAPVRGALRPVDVVDGLRLYLDAHQRGDPLPVRFPTERYVDPRTGRSGAHGGKAHT